MCFPGWLYAGFLVARNTSEHVGPRADDHCFASSHDHSQNLMIGSDGHPFFCTLGGSRRVRCRMKQIRVFLGTLSALLLAFLLPSCNAVNPLCGSARPAPVITSLSPTTVTFAQVQKGVVLTVNGSDFVTASVVVINGTGLATTFVSSTELQATITTAQISGPGTASVTVNTPGGTTGTLACSSGGTSSALVLTITS